MITVTSAASFFGGHFAGPYNSSKASVERFIDTIRAELRNFSIRVSSVVSGAIKTPMWKTGPENTKEHVNLDESNPYTNMMLRGAELGEEVEHPAASGKPAHP